jgi:hypothetical protein
MPEPLVVVSTRSTNGRLLIAALLIAALIFAWLGVRWQIGSLIAASASTNDPEIKNIAESARDLAPSDPYAMWLYATANRDLISSENVGPSLTRFEDVVRRSPHDYRWWIELGRTAEQAGDAELAHSAFTKAIELAPSHAYPHWQMGNFLLRADRTDDALSELRRAASNDHTYREQAFSLVWDYFEHDAARVEGLAGDAPDARVGLAFFFAARGQAKDSLRIWNTLDDGQKAENVQIAKTIAQAFTERKFFKEGLEFSRQTGIDPDAQIETITNGGFERSIGNADDNYYGWNVDRSDNKLDISTDSSVKHSGIRALKLNFRAYVKPQLADPSQIVVVEPGHSYTLSFWVRTENLRSAGMPTIQVVDPAAYQLLATSQPVVVGSNDWQEMSVRFKAAEKSHGVVIQLARSFCGDACPIVGTLWLDDVSLIRN